MATVGGQETVVEEAGTVEIGEAETEEAGTREVTGARIEALSSLVPPYMMGAIRQDIIKGEWKAGVTMKFSMCLDVQGAISFEIVDQKVEYLAEKLFNAHLEREGHRRVFYYGDAERRLRIGGGCTLLSCTTEAIPRFFGQLITQGNLEAPHRKEEQQRAGSSITETVIMSRFDEIGKGALITVSLGPTAASQLFEKLFRAPEKSA